MHEFLGDAADIDAGAAEPPGGSLGRGFDEVAHRDLLAEPGQLLAAGQAAGPPAYHDYVELVIVGLGVDQPHQFVLGL